MQISIRGREILSTAPISPFSRFAGASAKRGPEDGDAKETPVLRDSNSQSRRTGVSFARNK